MNQRAQETDRPQDAAARWTRRPLLVAVALAVVLGCLLAVSSLLKDGRQPVQLNPPEPAAGDLPKSSRNVTSFSLPTTADGLKQEAIRTAEELLRAYPESTDSIRVAAHLQSSLGNSDVASALWHRCTEVDPNCAEAYRSLGQIALGNGKFQDAAPMFAKAALLAPNDSMAPALQADALMKSDRAEEAVAVLESHLRGRAFLDKAMLTLGQAYVQLNELDKAKQTFEALIRADPDEARAYYGLARVCAKLGRTDESQQNMEKFQSLGSVDFEQLAREKRMYVDAATVRDILAKTLFQSGQVFRNHGDPAKAEEMWQKAAALEPENVPSRYQLLHLYEEQRRDHDALKLCEDLCRIEPETPDHWLFVGLLHHRLGRFEDALAALRRATQLDPGNPRYEQAYEIIKQEE